MVVALVAAVLATATFPVSAQDVSENLTLPLAVSLDATSADCSNNPGPWITFSGLVALGDVHVDLIFRNNVKGTHEAVVESTSHVSLSFDDQITIPKQPVQGGVGGNPHIWVQFVDASGKAVSDEIYLGRCVQGFDSSAEADLDLPAGVSLSVTGDGCTNNPGPTITLSGELAVSGLNALVIFRNNLKGTHEAIRESSATIEIIPSGMTVQIPKQPVLGGVGGNPRVSIVLSTEDDSTGEIYLGRCVQDL